MFVGWLLGCWILLMHGVTMKFDSKYCLFRLEFRNIFVNSMFNYENCVATLPSLFLAAAKTRFCVSLRILRSVLFVRTRCIVCGMLKYSATCLRLIWGWLFLVEAGIQLVFWNIMQHAWSCEKWRSVTLSQWAEEYPTRNKKTEG